MALGRSLPGGGVSDASTSGPILDEALKTHRRGEGATVDDLEQALGSGFGGV